MAGLTRLWNLSLDMPSQASPAVRFPVSSGHSFRNAFLNSGDAGFCRHAAPLSRRGAISPNAILTRVAVSSGVSSVTCSRRSGVGPFSAVSPWRAASLPSGEVRR